MELESGIAPTKGLKCSWRHSAGWINNSQSAYPATAGASAQCFSTSLSCGWENECWRQWREISQKWQEGHTRKVLPSQHVWSLSPCLVLIAFQDTHEIKMTLITHYFDSSCRNRAMKISYQDGMCTYPRIFLMSLLCSINCDRLQVHANIFFPVKACLDSPGCIKKSSWSLYMLLWKVSEHLILQFNAHTKKSISVCFCFKNSNIYEETSSVSALSWAFWELLYGHVNKSRMSCINPHPPFYASYFKLDFGFSGVSARCNRSINVKLPCS